MEAAAQKLDAGAFKLWMYFAKNQNGYDFALSSKDASASFGIGRSQYDTAVKKLIAAGYLTNTCGNNYIFSEVPAAQPDKNTPLHQNNTTTLSENNTRNNINNTGATAGDNGSLTGTLYLPSATAEVGTLYSDGPKVPRKPEDHEEIRRIEPAWLHQQMKRCMPVRHVRDDIIQLGSGKMYRVPDWDGALYDEIMQYADRCNEYIERNRRNPKLQGFISRD